MTQNELAIKAGTTKSYISKIEKGCVEPGVDNLHYRFLQNLYLRRKSQMV